MTNGVVMLLLHSFFGHAILQNAWCKVLITNISAMRTRRTKLISMTPKLRNKPTPLIITSMHSIHVKRIQLTICMTNHTEPLHMLYALHLSSKHIRTQRRDTNPLHITPKHPKRTENMYKQIQSPDTLRNINNR